MTPDPNLPRRATETPTQVAFPLRAAVRTLIAVLVGLGVAPLILTALQEPLGLYLPPSWWAALAWFAGLCAAISTGVTRVLAIPQVNVFVTKWLNLGAEPKGE